MKGERNFLMKKCPNCGESNHDLQDVCVSCGASLPKGDSHTSSKKAYSNSETKSDFSWTRLVAVLSLLGLVANFLIFIISFFSPIFEIGPFYYLIIIAGNFFVVMMLFELADVVEYIK